MAKEGSRITGVVSSFNNSKGFGFIKSKQVEEEFFVHHSSIKSDGFRTLSVGSTVEFTVAIGNDKRVKAVDVTGLAGAPVRSVTRFNRDESNCYNCDKPGHFARNCPERPSSGGARGSARGGTCFKCNEEGHLARDCDVEVSNGGGRGGDVECYECKQLGHIARKCPSRNGGGGGGNGRGDNVECYECNELGHIARDCPTRGEGGGGGRRNGGGAGAGACYGCGGFGHMARDCDRGNRGGGGRFGGDNNVCFTCGGVGHFARQCPS